MYQNIGEFYDNECAEEDRLSSQAGQVEYITTMRYLLKCCPPKCRILDACAGTGIYAFKLAEYGYEVTAGDLIESNVEKMRRQNAAVPLLSEISQTDIRDLSRFENERFKVKHYLCYSAPLSMPNKSNEVYFLCPETENKGVLCP
jgi:2-polyprenyl-3-methyl-5-hydroxy-6-metoxy-1,4-benzoquinol methylase